MPVIQIKKDRRKMCPTEKGTNYNIINKIDMEGL
jgi:hypothetical protein